MIKIIFISYCNINNTQHISCIKNKGSMKQKEKNKKYKNLLKIVIIQRIVK